VTRVPSVKSPIIDITTMPVIESPCSVLQVLDLVLSDVRSVSEERQSYRVDEMSLRELVDRVKGNICVVCVIVMTSHSVRVRRADYSVFKVLGVLRVSEI
jgi:SepF-like predicted cell division protein (DUF552 family)